MRWDWIVRSYRSALVEDMVAVLARRCKRLASKQSSKQDDGDGECTRGEVCGEARPSVLPNSPKSLDRARLHVSRLGDSLVRILTARECSIDIFSREY